ncbi:MAG: YceI family protein [Elusimicrobiota bacterium]|jgi:polyisoprenoid-binding protein YceI
MRRIIPVSLILLALTPWVQAVTFTIDPSHSSVSFRVKHVVGKVLGHFDQFNGIFNYDPANLKTGSAQATIQIGSISTGIGKRDNHLRSPDFLEVQKFPVMTFKSTGITDVNGSHAKLHGDLMIHGVTRPVILDLDVAGMAKDPMGPGQRAGATATTRIDRRDFGVGPTTGPIASMVGNDVEITIEVEGASQ